MVATPGPERVPRDGERCELVFSSWRTESLVPDKDSALGVDAGGASGSSRMMDDWRVEVVDDCG
jgi:hypothetical protein